MKQVEAPQVFLVAQTKLDEEGLDDYLTSIGLDRDENDWFADPRVSDAENLLEAAGRLCYRSWIPWDPEKPEASNPNVTKVREGNNRYLANVIRSEHGSCLEHANVTFILKDVSRVFCYHPGTEVFTRRGWKLVKDLSDDEILLTKDPDTGYARWSKNKKLHVHEYKGRLITAQTSQLSLPPVTPEHLLWCAPYDVRASRGLSLREILDNVKARKVQASEVYGKRVVLDLGINFSDAPTSLDEQVTVGDYTYPKIPFFSWLGWMATDGTTSSIKNGRYRCVINQSKVDNFGEIRSLMNLLFEDRWSEYGPYTESSCASFGVPDRDLQSWVIEHLGPSKLERVFSSTILSSSSNCLSAFYRAALKGDGNVHQKNGYEVLYLASARAAGQWQFILACLGKAGNVRCVDRIGEEHIINGNVCRTNHLQYVVSVSRKNATMLNYHHWEKIPYKGRVYCPETEDGIVFVRYGSGIPVWSGNTHEFCRHRAGVSPSQESLRYVRLDGDIRFWIPGLARTYSGVPELLEETVDYLAMQQKKLHKLCGIDGIKNFTLKKMLTSMFRRVAPIGLSTSIMVTGNLRAWRHIINLRTSEAAEEEIRLVIGQVARLLKEQYPNVFFDMQENDVGEWIFEHPKV